MADGCPPSARSTRVTLPVELRSRTQRAFDGAARPVHVDLTIAGIPVRFTAIDADLLDRYTRALRHHAPPDGGERPDIEVRLWDERGSGVPRPRLPAELHRQIVAREPITCLPGHLVDYDPSARSLTLVDPADHKITVCLGDRDELPQWERAAPLRAALGWILRIRDTHLLHAAAVADAQGRVALLIGAGGAGKSSTALNCREGGMGFLGDDICAVRSGDRPSVHNVYGTAKLLWSDLPRYPSLRSLLVSDSHRYEDKAVFDVGAVTEPAIVRSGPPVVLAIVDRSLPVGSVVPARAQQAVAIAAPTTGGFLHTSPRQSLLVTLADLARRTPVVRLSPPRASRDAADLVSSVIQSATRTPTASSLTGAGYDHFL